MDIEFQKDQESNFLNQNQLFWWGQNHQMLPYNPDQINEQHLFDQYTTELLKKQIMKTFESFGEFMTKFDQESYNYSQNKVYYQCELQMRQKQAQLDTIAIASQEYLQSLYDIIQKIEQDFNKQPNNVQIQEKFANFQLFFMVWKLVDIYFIKKGNSKTYEFVKLSQQVLDKVNLKLFKKELQNQENIEEKEIFWTTLYDYLVRGDFSNVINFLENTSYSQDKDDSQFQRLISLLNSRSWYNKKDKYALSNKNKFLLDFDLFNEKQLRYEMKQKNMYVDDVLILCDILTGNKENIEQICDKSWWKAINCYFLFINPVPKRDKIKTFINILQHDFDFVFDENDIIFQSIISNKNAIDFIEIYGKNCPNWLKFHYIDMFTERGNFQQTQNNSMLEQTLHNFLLELVINKIEFESINPYLTKYMEEFSIDEQKKQFLIQILLNISQYSENTSIKKILKIAQEKKLYEVQNIYYLRNYERFMKNNDFQGALEQLVILDNKKLLNKFQHTIMKMIKNQQNFNLNFVFQFEKYDPQNLSKCYSDFFECFKLFDQLKKSLEVNPQDEKQLMFQKNIINQLVVLDLAPQGKFFSNEIIIELLLQVFKLSMKMFQNELCNLLDKHFICQFLDKMNKFEKQQKCKNQHVDLDIIRTLQYELINLISYI